ncbi:Hypothetical predicted protein [Cloeon dipterum]|uniref:Peptidoglycan-recognition protein n=1 Tax=Cloeon dipterum TaxID=197152 RepID=A0A8S1C0F9_9INSE|nr:Hypothetical predicted protein [Cloeon dipterum]
MKVLIVIAALVAYAAAQSCPNIVSRAEWGARAPTGITYLNLPVPFVVIHHGASGSCSTQAGCSDIVRSYQDQHMDVNGWSDIGYNFIVGGDGNVYEGRSWDKVGAHAPGYNSQSIGICFIGTFTSSTPASSAINAAQQLIACGVGQGNVAGAYSLIGHRQAVTTECPGDALYAEIQGWPNWDANP